MQYAADQEAPYHPYRWLKCGCGVTIDSGEFKQAEVSSSPVDIGLDE